MNRRKHTRKRVDVALTIQVGDNEPVSARANDMSVGGMFITGDAPFEFGAVVTLQISLPDLGTPVEAEATVRWVGGGGIGVQFAALGARATYEITEYVARCPAIRDMRDPADE